MICIQQILAITINTNIWDQETKIGLAVVAHTYNPSDSGSRDQKAWTNDNGMSPQQMSQAWWHMPVIQVK
jgi:hypothetical protein